jgi:hypothetical protein
MSIEVRCYILFCQQISRRIARSTMTNPPSPLCCEIEDRGGTHSLESSRVEVTDAHVITNTGYVTKWSPRSSGFAVSGARRLDLFPRFISLSIASTESELLHFSALEKASAESILLLDWWKRCNRRSLKIRGRTARPR